MTFVRTLQAIYWKPWRKWQSSTQSRGQFTNSFSDCFEKLLPWLEESLFELNELPPVERMLQAICWIQLRWLAHEPDGLIHRKVGAKGAQEVRERAQSALSEVSNSGRGCPFRDSKVLSTTEAYLQFDHFLRSAGNRFNPGTTADLIAATLLIYLITKNEGE